MFNLASRKFFLEQGQAEKYYEGGLELGSINYGGTASFSRSFYNRLEGDDWIDLAAGANWMLAIKDNGQGTTSGTLWAWGNNGRWAHDGWAENALGLGDYKHYATIPTQVGTADNWTNVWAGQFVSFGLKTDGTLWAWGDPYSSGTGGLGLSATNLGLGASVPTQIGTADNWTSILSVGGAFGNRVLTINQDGELYGWGRNNESFGLGDNTNRGIPTSLTGSTGWTTVTTGIDNSFAIKDGYIYATGRNNQGQLGTGDTTDRNTWTQITGPSFTDVAPVSDTTYAIRSDGTLWGWGDGSQWFLPNSADSYTPVQIGIDTNWEKFISTQNYYAISGTLVKKTNGELYVVNPRGQYSLICLSLYQTGYDASPLLSAFNRFVIVDTDTALQPLAGYADRLDTTGDASFSVGVTKGEKCYTSGHILKNGRIYSCGSNFDYCFGAGIEYDIKVRKDYTNFYGILNGLSWTNAVTTNILFLVKNDGTLWVVGEFGANVDPTGSNNLSGNYWVNTQYYEPTQVGTDTFWKDVLSFLYAQNYSAVVKSDGTYWNTGARNNFNPYSNETSNVAIWTQAGSDSDWEWITSGYTNFYAKKGGYLYAWGENSDGQLGLGDNTDRFNSGIYQVDSNSWTKVVGCQRSAIGLRTDGTIWATGDGRRGETGLGSETDVNTFTQIGTANNWTDITRTNQTTAALNSSGEIWHWGPYSAIYTLSNTSNWTPSKVNDDTDWVKIFSNQITIYAVKSDGSVWVISGFGKKQAILSTQVLQGINGEQWSTNRPHEIVSSSNAPTEDIKIAAWGNDRVAYIK